MTPRHIQINGNGNRCLLVTLYLCSSWGHIDRESVASYKSPLWPLLLVSNKDCFSFFIENIKLQFPESNHGKVSSS